MLTKVLSRSVRLASTCPRASLSRLHRTSHSSRLCKSLSTFRATLYTSSQLETPRENHEPDDEGVDPDREPKSLQQSTNPPSELIFLRGLPYSTTEDDVKKMAQEYGPVDQVRILRWEGGLSRGMAHVRFFTVASAQAFHDAAIAAPIYLLDRYLQVSYSTAHMLGPSTADTDKEMPYTYEIHQPSQSLYVGNLPVHLSREEVRNKLLADIGRFGQIKWARIPLDSDGGLRGYAHLRFASLESATKALEEHQRNPFRLGSSTLWVHYTKMAVEPISRLYLHAFPGPVRLVMQELQKFQHQIVEVFWLQRRLHPGTDNAGGAFISFRSTEAATEALEQLDWKEVEGSRIRISYARPRKLETEDEREREERGPKKRPKKRSEGEPERAPRVPKEELSEDEEQLASDIFSERQKVYGDFGPTDRDKQAHKKHRVKPGQPRWAGRGNVRNRTGG